MPLRVSRKAPLLGDARIDAEAYRKRPIEVVAPYEVTRFTKSRGPLTKRITLGDDGGYLSDGSACLMVEGKAERFELAGAADLAILIAHLEPNQALALGALREEHPHEVAIVTKNKLNGRPDTIARTASEFVYRRGEPAFALLDFDTKGMPADVRARLDAAGGFWGALLKTLPPIAEAATVERHSTSAGLYNNNTGEKLAGSYGMHVYVAVRDGSDVERFLKVLHSRCWLAGFGWYVVGAAGDLLDRSIVDRMVYAPERLVFEGAPLVEAPLAQDVHSRRPVVHPGFTFDTVNGCPTLTIAETASLDKLRHADKQRVGPKQAEARAAYIEHRAADLAVRTDVSIDRARHIVERQCDGGVLFPSAMLPFDDPELAGKTAADVLADPAQYERETLADPIEGVEYGRGKAIILRGSDGWPWIYSFAHGRTDYQLRYDAAAISAAISGTTKDAVVRRFVDMAERAELDEAETAMLIADVAELSGVGIRVVKQQLERLRAERGAAAREAARAEARRLDTRPNIDAPRSDAERLPVVRTLNDVLSTSTADEPPMRDFSGNLIAIIDQTVQGLHELSAADSNGEAQDDATRLPAPEQPLMTRLNERQTEELIERHICFTNKDGEPVALSPSFIAHYVSRPGDQALPIVRGVATLPIVLPNGEILAKRGLDRQRQIVMRTPHELVALIPRREDCDEEQVRAAMRFLTDEWLCDVATDYAGKAVLIAQAASIIERHVLPERPAFWITAGHRGGGKTTAENMVAIAVTGKRAPAAAWSPSSEERRKALFSYLEQGVSLLVWDNIPLGEAISCPSIEKALTSETYSDRILGRSEIHTVPSTTVVAFTGNNIEPVGDMTSRSLMTRIEVDRTDPENRPFRHADPIGWTETNRGKILQAIYTVLLGNPQLAVPGLRDAETRFKVWWKLVGSAIEHAADEHAADQVRFAAMFLEGEDADNSVDALAQLLTNLKAWWPDKFTSADVIGKIPPDYVPPGKEGEYDPTLAELIEVGTKHPRVFGKPITAQWANVALRKIEGRPVKMANGTVMKLKRDNRGRVAKFEVE